MLSVCGRERCREAGHIVRERKHEEGGTYCDTVAAARRAAASA